MVAKYNNLDAQLQGVTFELQQMCVSASMDNVMAGMAKIMSGANSKMKNNDYQQTMKRFMTEKERMNVMNEYVQDIMEGDNQEIEDDDVDKLIDDMTQEQVAKQKKKSFWRKNMTAVMTSVKMSNDCKKMLKATSLAT